MPTKRISFLNVDFDCLTMDDVLDRLRRVTPTSPYAYLVTPNVDHVVRLNETPCADLLKAAYWDSDVCLCDSRVLRRIAGFYDVNLPVVPGSDLTVRLLDNVVVAGDRVAIVGGDEALVQELHARYPAIIFVQNRPPMGLRHSVAARHQVAQFIAGAGARFVLIAVGSPQQELIAADVRSLPNARGTALCIGASLDFIIGRQRRAPHIMQKLSLEWAYRLWSEPRRLWRRYLVEGPRIFVLAMRYQRGGSAH
jgi:exopolysaccharide biosynthesis WecB/TagA/CpsF family protein